MDAYPPEYTNHEFPLILLSGLEDSADTLLKGSVVDCPAPPVQSDVAKLLVQDFHSLRGQNHEWSARASRSKNGLIPCRFKHVGRVRVLPPKCPVAKLIRFRDMSFLLAKLVLQVQSI